ncbi:hypothetical protein [Mucilaginibacter panaciglaebae]|uniref:CCDC81-like prokaryotic HU domain-containing protein n=1 Tax=Mucilaginibacter panaciglaebae TaxID=502331 RepID=A0ABP7WHK9_9SPHI
MDVGFYLGELLMQQGEVSVPGLGYFVQARVSGYYDENERKFYPPYHQAQFDLQSIDDDALAEYIAVKKNISLASARYFAEKYITNLKHQALITEVAIGNLGWFYTEMTQLTFRPAPKIIDDTIFFGFEPVSISKANDTRPVEERPKVELDFTNRSISKPAAVEEVQDGFIRPTPLNQEPVNAPSYETQPQGTISPEFFDPEEAHTTSSFSGALRVVLFVLIGIIIIGVGVFALYRYQPDTFAKITFWKQPQPVETAKPKLIPVVKPAETLASDSLKVDTNTVTTAPAATDTLTQPANNQKVISETPVDQGTASKSKILSVTPADQSKAVNKKEIVVSKTPVNPTAVPLPNTTKKKETVVSQAAATTKPATTKAKPTGAGTAGNNSSLIAKPSDAVGTRRFEVYAVTTSSIAEANAAIRRMRKFGLDPRIVTDAPGSLIHISIGHFTTKQEATELAFKEIEAGHIPGGNAYGFEIIPQK